MGASDVFSIRSDALRPPGLGIGLGGIGAGVERAHLHPGGGRERGERAVEELEIAQRELSAICHAVGVLQVNDSQELHYKPMVIRVDLEERDGYSPRNVIKAFKAPVGGPGNAPTPPSATAAAATPASPSSPPWAQRAA